MVSVEIRANTDMPEDEFFSLSYLFLTRVGEDEHVMDFRLYDSTVEECIADGKLYARAENCAALSPELDYEPHYFEVLEMLQDCCVDAELDMTLGTLNPEDYSIWNPNIVISTGYEGESVRLNINSITAE